MAVHPTPYRLMAAVLGAFLLLLSTTTSVVDGFGVPYYQRADVFSPSSTTLARHLSRYSSSLSQQQQPRLLVGFVPPRSLVVLSGNQKNDDSSSSSIGLSESDQGVLGVAGTVAALITFYSEFTLKQTGCGLPAGPFGLVGLVEGLSYLGVTAIVAYSLVKKVQSGSGLPAGPGGLLGLAEGLSFLAIVGGLVVLGFQLLDYGYVPNAVPMEGGMCS